MHIVLLVAASLLGGLMRGVMPLPISGNPEMVRNLSSLSSSFTELLPAPDLTPCYQDGERRVGIQVGHWKAAEVPEELENLRYNTGATAGGHTELEVMLKLGEMTKSLLEDEGISVDLLPTTIPPSYCADLFLSLHADGNEDTSVRGYKAVAPWWDAGPGTEFVALLEEAYGQASKLPIDSAITRTMRGYYAFNYRRFEHAVNVDTPAAILETGFLTNAQDRKFLVERTPQAAGAIAESVILFIEGRSY